MNRYDRIGAGIITLCVIIGLSFLLPQCAAAATTFPDVTVYRSHTILGDLEGAWMTGDTWGADPNPLEYLYIPQSTIDTGLLYVQTIDDATTHPWVFHYGYVEAPSPVPLPAAFYLFASSLIGLVAVARRERKGV